MKNSSPLITLGILNYQLPTPEALEEKAYLHQDEKTRFLRFTHADSARAFLGGRALTRKLISARVGQSESSILFEGADRSKPRCKSHPDWRFNLSHSKALVAAALGRQEIGLDLEIRRDNRDLGGIAKTVFTPNEQESLFQDSKIVLSRFYLLWTLKEAWLKLRGCGFSGLARSPEFFVDKSDTVAIVPFRDGSREPPFSVLCWELESDKGDIYFLSLAFDSPTLGMLAETEFTFLDVPLSKIRLVASGHFS